MLVHFELDSHTPLFEFNWLLCSKSLLQVQMVRIRLRVSDYGCTTQKVLCLISSLCSALHCYKKLFWVPAIAPLLSVIISTFFVYITHAEKDGVQIVRHIKQGVNPPSIDQIYFNGDYLVKGFKIGVVAGLIALTEAVAIGRTFAAMKDYQIDGNKEMVAL
ncbi:hypothetical protein POM88_012609 [Heracleum sosnowskyi]|uniref:SLC26A/SulP transporter domain-containing protein n=1 Tax=Heracleum sosnowskyi TaxID=360622 RepID=A0AAD8IZ11_9APIA|nr:hypothetical protein POM88_012609 [Heracleum sosnowskyi]